MLVRQPAELLVMGPAVDPRISFATTMSSGGALAFVAWEAVLTLDDEVKYIWLKPSKMCIKWIYLFSKWFGLVYQISIQVVHSTIAARFPASLKFCEGYFLYEAVNLQIMQFCLDWVLILRIRAVHQRHRVLVTIVAVSLVIFEFVMSTVSQVYSIPASIVDGACIVLYTPLTTTFLGIGFMVSQTVLLCLTYRRKVLMQPGVRRSSIIVILVRDGLLAFGVMIGVLSLATLYLVFNQAVINAFFPWMPAAITVLTCRIVLNMQSAAEREEASEVQLSTGPWLSSTEIQLSIVTTDTDRSAE